MLEVYCNCKTATRKYYDNGEHLNICTMGSRSNQTYADRDRPNEIRSGGH